ncbi:MAG: glycosyltransferase [Candidatus Hydrogenedentes bacterium]|nr:glycosyltransferase [Candidatus Hydrogenedentota bacterium]
MPQWIGGHLNQISVVIPAYNEEQFLPATIASIRRAEAHLGKPVEIVVADNMSTDCTASVALSLGARVVPVEVRCISTVRNRGAAAATGDYLVFVDADDHMSENLLSEVRRTLDSGRYIGGGVARTRYDRDSLGIRFTHGLVQTALSFTGLSMFLFYTSAENFAAMHGFDETLLCTEDYDFARRLRVLARKRGLRYKNMRSAHLVKSARKFGEFGDWAFLRKPILSIRAAMNDGDAAYELWYKPRRDNSGIGFDQLRSESSVVCTDDA